MIEVDILIKIEITLVEAWVKILRRMNLNNQNF